MLGLWTPVGFWVGQEASHLVGLGIASSPLRSAEVSLQLWLLGQQLSSCTAIRCRQSVCRKAQHSRREPPKAAAWSQSACTCSLRVFRSAVGTAGQSTQTCLRVDVDDCAVAKKINQVQPVSMCMYPWDVQ